MLAYDLFPPSIVNDQINQDELKDFFTALKNILVLHCRYIAHILGVVTSQKISIFDLAIPVESQNFLKFY